jgi:predicted transcriptional regulator
MSKRGFAPPNHTQAPNEFYDRILPEIDTLAELKVTDIIIRQTFGWHMRERELSLGKLEELTGLTRTSVSDGLKRAMKRGTVSRRKVGNSYAYKLVVEEVDQSKPSTTDSIASRFYTENGTASRPVQARH